MIYRIDGDQMKKLNNKGFAISTLLYGLMLVAFLTVSLLMSIMSTNRKNTSTLIRKIEEDLNRFSQTTTELSSTDGTQEFIVPYGKAGWYKIELWGGAAKNVDATVESENGRGAYTSGIIYLAENTHLYFQIGSIGGTAGTKNNTTSSYGGGATDVRLVGGNWNSTEGLNSRIMVAAGGSYSTTTGRRGTGYGYADYYSLKYPNGTYDGGSYISGFAGQTAHGTYKFISTMMASGVNAGAGKAKIELVSSQGPDNPPAKKTTFLNGVRYITECVKYTASQSKEVWREIQAIDSTGTNRAAGKTVRYAKYDAIANTSPTVAGFTDGNLTAVNTTKTSSLPKVGGYHDVCIRVDLGTDYNLEEITAFHNNPDPLSAVFTANYSTSIITVSGSSGTRSIRYVGNNIYTPTETYMGVKVSDRNPEITSGTLPTGNYYIQSALSDNRFVTVGTGPGRLNLFTGNKDQRWSITQVATGQYKILDGIDQMALQPTDGGLEIGESVSAPTKYQEHDWEKWAITPIYSSGNGYYQIKMVNKNLCMATVSTIRDTSGALQIKTCSKTDRTQWFRFVNADY